jgi:hypothetical protein
MSIILAAPHCALQHAPIFSLLAAAFAARTVFRRKRCAAADAVQFVDGEFPHRDVALLIEFRTLAHCALLGLCSVAMPVHVTTTIQPIRDFYGEKISSLGDWLSQSGPKYQNKKSRRRPPGRRRQAPTLALACRFHSVAAGAFSADREQPLQPHHRRMIECGRDEKISMHLCYVSRHDFTRAGC